MNTNLDELHLPFWKRKTLSEMSPKEWELLCDGCGRCCMEKFEDATTNRIYYTNVACYFFDISTCQCTVYGSRTAVVPECVALSPKNIKSIKWLPPTCAYRLIQEGKSVEWWHPLISGTPESIHESGISVKGKAIPMENVHPDDLENFIINW